MPRYAVRLRIDCSEPPTAQQLVGMRGGRWGISATRRGGMVSVAMLMDAGDPAGALARCMNVVLDRVPGAVVHAETDQLADVVPVTRRRKRR